MQIAASPEVAFVSVDDIPEAFMAKEKESEMAKESLSKANRKGGLGQKHSFLGNIIGVFDFGAGCICANAFSQFFIGI